LPFRSGENKGEIMENTKLPAVVQRAVQTQGIDLENVNFLLPTQTFGQIIGNYDKVVIEVVQINPDEDAFEVAKDKFSPGKRPLMAIANALGIVWDPKTTGVVESTDRKSRAKATGAMRKPNGEWVVISDEKTVDLDVIEEEQHNSNEERAEKGDQDNILDWKTSSSGKKYPVLGQWKSDAEKRHWIEKATKKAVLQYRKFKDERAMTGAKERVIREFVALKNTYSRKELSQPFAFPRVIPDTEKMLSHPEVRQAAIQKMTGAVTSIFGPGPSGSSQEIPRGESPKYELIENGNGGESPKENQGPEEQAPPWESPKEQTDEEKAHEELEEMQKIDHLPAGAKSMIADELAKEKPDLKTMNALIDRVNDWLEKDKKWKEERKSKKGGEVGERTN